jgi:hypothetical protein
LRNGGCRVILVIGFRGGFRAGVEISGIVHKNAAIITIPQCLS